MSDSSVEALRNEVAELRAEVRQLRTEMDKLKGSATASSSASDVTAKAKQTGNFGAKFHQWNTTALAKAPQKIARAYAAIKDGKIYVNGGLNGESPNVYCLDMQKDKWITLPQSTQFYGSLVVIQDMVTYVGGRLVKSNIITGNLLSYQGTGKKGEWQECLPPMPTPRYFASSIVKDNYLIVVGGDTPDGRVPTVEILNIDTMEWTEASPLPEPTNNASMVIAGDTLYVLAGMKKYGYNYSNAAYSCSFSELVQSTPDDDDDIWETLPNLSSDFAVATVMCDTVVAIGGFQPDSQYNAIKNLVAYSPKNKKWNNIGFLSKPLGMSCTVQLDEGSKTLLVGGQVGPNRELDDVEIIEAKN